MTISSTYQPNPAGILPYGSNDSTVIFRSPLTSEASITSPEVGASEASVMTLVGSGGTFDSVKGFKAGDTTTNLGVIKIAELVGYGDLDNAGNISFEIEADAVASIDGTNQTGKTSAAYLLSSYIMRTSTTAGTGAGVNQRMYVGSAADSSWLWPEDAASGVEAAKLFSVIGLGDFVRVDLSWIGDKLTAMLDGMIVHVHTRAQVADLYKYMYFGSSKEATNAGLGLPWYIRNLQISTRPVMFPTRYDTRVSLVGDSFIEQAHQAERDAPHGYAVPKYQVRGADIMNAYFMNRGSQLDIYGRGVSGDEITQVAARQADILSDNPTHIIMQIGTNDAINNDSAATFDGLIRSEIADYLAAGVEVVFVCTLPTFEADNTRPAEDEVSRNEFNVVIRDLSDIATIIDMEAALPYGNNYFDGEVKNTFDNVHPAAGGQIIEGTEWAKALYAIL